MQMGPHLMYQYFVKVVPTMYIDIKGKTTPSAQFSVMEHPKCVAGARQRAPCLQIFADARARSLLFRRAGAWTF